MLKVPEYCTLHVTNFYRLSQGCDFVLFCRYKLLCNIITESSFFDRPHDCSIIQLLAVVYFMPARNATGMVVPEILVVVRDRPDHITFINLHVVDVVQ